MPNNGNNFRHALAEYIRGWGEGLAVEEEKYIGWTRPPPPWTA